MCKKKNGWFCLLVILLVFFSAMNFEDLRSNSSVMFLFTGTADSYLSSAEPVEVDIKACTNEMLDSHHNMGLEQSITRYTYHKKNTRLSRDYLLQTVFFRHGEKSYTNCEKEQSLSHIQDDLVVIYIHKSDGKKRI